MPKMPMSGGNVAPVIAPKAWGHEVTIAVTDRVAMKIVSLDPGTAISRQVHLVKDEIYYVLSGSGVLELGPRGEIQMALAAGEAQHVPPMTVHRLVAGPVGITIIEASTPEVTDIVRLDDRYDRPVNPGFDPVLYEALLH